LGDSGVLVCDNGTQRFRVIGDIIIRCLRVIVPFAIERGVKSAEAGPLVGDVEPMMTLQQEENELR
jgi:hypothetical protein